MGRGTAGTGRLHTAGKAVPTTGRSTTIKGQTPGQFRAKMISRKEKGREANALGRGPRGRQELKIPETEVRFHWGLTTSDNRRGLVAARGTSRQKGKKKRRSALLRRGFGVGDSCEKNTTKKGEASTPSYRKREFGARH